MKMAKRGQSIGFSFTVVLVVLGFAILPNFFGGVIWFAKIPKKAKKILEGVCISALEFFLCSRFI